MQIIPKFKLDDTEAPLWHYCDFTKLVSILEKQALFFPKATLLDDPEEGRSSHETLFNLQHILQECTQLGLNFSHTPIQDDNNDQIYQRIIQEFVLIHSWHINRVESMAMWKIFLSNREGVAIKTHLNRLIQSIQNPEEHKFYAGQVKYVSVEVTQPIEAFFLKNQHFAYEQELRIVIDAYDYLTRSIQKSKNTLKDPLIRTLIRNSGLYIRIDIPTLIEEVIISPEAPDWFSELVRAIIRKYGHDIKVRNSSIQIKT